MSDKEQMKLFDLLNLISDSPESRRCLEQTIYQRKRRFGQRKNSY